MSRSEPHDRRPIEHGRAGHAVAAVVAAALLAGACAGPPVPNTPVPATDVFQELALAGASTVNLVSGDPGCSDANMIPYAIHAQVKMPPGAAATSDVYLFTWANRAGWTRGAVAFESCRSEFAAGSKAAGRPVDEIDMSPYRMFGAGWSPALKTALTQALTKAAGDGS